jgi:hypothetical protein
MKKPTEISASQLSSIVKNYEMIQGASLTSLFVKEKLVDHYIIAIE